MPEITVVVPTYKRPDGLSRAVSSLLQQTGVPDFDILIVDNDPNASAKNAADDLRAQSESNNIRYIHEPNAGVANARNAAMDNLSTRLVAFLDDDQSVPRNWLHSLLDFHAANPAPVSFGPVVTKLPKSSAKHIDYLKAFFARELDVKSGYIDHFYGCGNALLDLSIIQRKGPLFDTSMNECGGEDDLLFQSLKERGERFGWCAEAPAFEHVPESRARLGYTLKRAFAYGQGPITLARKATPTRYGSILMWMGIGAAKFALNMLLYFTHWVTRAPNRAEYLDRAVRGAGKFFWWVKLKFYGSASTTSEAANQPCDPQTAHPHAQHS